MNMDNAYYKSLYTGELIPVRVVSMASGEHKVEVVLDWLRARPQSYKHCETIFTDFVRSIAGNEKDFSFSRDKDAAFTVWWSDLVNSENAELIPVHKRKVESKMKSSESDSNLELLRDVLSKLASAGYSVQDFDMNVAQGEVVLAATLKKEEVK